MSSVEESSGIAETSVQLEEPLQIGTEADQPSVAPVVSNHEAMVAQALSRIKKQAKQIQRSNTLLGQLPGRFRDLDRRQARQFAQIKSQIKQLQTQVRALKQAGRKTAIAAKKKKRKSAARKK